MPIDTLDEIEARAETWLRAFPGDRIALNALALIEMVRARDRVVEAARRVPSAAEWNALWDALAALDTPPAEEPTE